ncbi:MAG: asparagine synthase (glutamine-hydrolyzing) [Chitinophagaceae bacterium]
MCGIAGIIGVAPNQFTVDALQKMTHALAHRGPDGEALWVNENAAVLLGHRRLSVIDLSTAANQPMHYLNRYSIIHNGEIYNYLELKETLLQKGYQFSTKSDTEVILAAYDCYKEKCLQHFDGMFAFAIWDEQEKKLFAARDRFGEKPFYYYFNKEKKQLIFASELKALWAIGLPRHIDESMLLNYLSLGYTSHPTDPAKTFYSDYQKLPAAHYLKFSPYTNETNVEIIRYWKINSENVKSIPAKEAIRQFSHLFHLSIQQRLRSDVSIGTSLSGGLDSSSVAGGIYKQLSVNPLYKQQTFTASFPQFEKDESVFAKKIAAQFNLQQYFSYPSANLMASELEKLIQHHEEPIGSASVYAQYKIFQLAKEQGIKVLLDGQGADEILAGYSKYIHWFLQELLAKQKFSLFREEKKLLTQHGIPFKWTAINFFAAFFPALAKKQLEIRTKNIFLNDENIDEEFRNTFLKEEGSYKPIIHSLNDILNYNVTGIGLEELLRYADKNSMASGVEVRLPFLQHELVQFIFSLPSTLKINSGYTKWILRKAMEPLLPLDIVWRTEKIGFEPPQKDWMANSTIEELIRTAKVQLVKRGILKKSVLNKKIQPHSSYAAESNDWRYLSTGLLYS